MNLLFLCFLPVWYEAILTGKCFRFVTRENNFYFCPFLFLAFQLNCRVMDFGDISADGETGAPRRYFSGSLPYPPYKRFQTLLDCSSSGIPVPLILDFHNRTGASSSRTEIRMASPAAEAFLALSRQISDEVQQKVFLPRTMTGVSGISSASFHLRLQDGRGQNGFRLRQNLPQIHMEPAQSCAVQEKQAGASFQTIFQSVFPV